MFKNIYAVISKMLLMKFSAFNSFVCLLLNFDKIFHINSNTMANFGQPNSIWFNGIYWMENCLLDKTRVINKKAVEVFSQTNKFMNEKREEKKLRLLFFFLFSLVVSTYILSVHRSWTHTRLPSAHKGAI